MPHHGMAGRLEWYETWAFASAAVLLQIQTTACILLLYWRALCIPRKSTVEWRVEYHYQPFFCNSGGNGEERTQGI